MMTPVYVPSKGRSGHSATLSSLSEEGVQDVWIVTPPGETQKYEDTYRVECVGGWQVIPQAGDGIWGARQTALQHARAEGTRFWMLDDDITGAFWREGSKLKRTRLSTVMHAMDEKAATVVVAMYGPNFRHRAWTGPPAEWDVHLRNFVNVDPAVTADYWDNVKEDLDFVLQLLTSGLHTVRFNAWAFESPRMGTTEGGCWDDYAGGALDEATLALRDKWPGLVEVTLDEANGYVTNRVDWRAVRLTGQQARLQRGVAIL